LKDKRKRSGGGPARDLQVDLQDTADQTWRVTGICDLSVDIRDTSTHRLQWSREGLAAYNKPIITNW
jgi:hypothetical protein